MLVQVCDLTVSALKWHHIPIEVSVIIILIVFIGLSSDDHKLHIAKNINLAWVESTHVIVKFISQYTILKKNPFKISHATWCHIYKVLSVFMPVVICYRSKAVSSMMGMSHVGSSCHRLCINRELYIICNYWILPIKCTRPKRITVGGGWGLF